MACWSLQSPTADLAALEWASVQGCSQLGYWVVNHLVVGWHHSDFQQVIACSGTCTGLVYKAGSAIPPCSLAMAGLHRATAYPTLLTRGIQEDPGCRVSAGNGFGSGGSKTKHSSWLCMGFCAAPGELAPATFPVEAKVNIQNSLHGNDAQACPTVPWAVCCTVRLRGGRLAAAPRAEGPQGTRGRTDLRALACWSPCCWHRLHRAFLPLAAYSLPAVSRWDSTSTPKCHSQRRPAPCGGACARSFHLRRCGS